MVSRCLWIFVHQIVPCMNSTRKAILHLAELLFVSRCIIMMNSSQDFVDIAKIAMRMHRFKNVVSDVCFERSAILGDSDYIERIDLRNFLQLCNHAFIPVSTHSTRKIHLTSIYLCFSVGREVEGSKLCHCAKVESGYTIRQFQQPFLLSSTRRKWL